MFHDKLFVRVLALFLSACLVMVPVSSLGQTSPEQPTQAKFTYVLTGKVTPFTGYLFSPEAIFKVMADSEFKLKSVELSKDTELKRQEAQFDLKFGTLQITYDSLKKQNEEINKVKDEEIKELRKIVEKQNKPDYTAAWFGGGIGLGVVLTVVLYFVIQEVKK